eukprot:CAMPEP_0119320018 /NCGR_PEP_ID=MMETSP1333-20130426/51167_1 /TAXON_ID=418940 /ORGANISM="Scyphosphaera apsteinii, Strain RCC1455" /LENGTH=512 /DNA_ID=CAMNT_0007326607 /DNA_START=74 /DNA_END=1612 /DNA_ORIENTATION=-
MMSSDGANPFAPAGAADSTYYEAVSSSQDNVQEQGQIGCQDPAAAVRSSAPPQPPPSEPDFGAQSFQDLDISSPPPAAAATQPAPRFESKAMESGSGGSTVGSSTSSPDLHVTVSNPSKQGDGISAYFTYEVITKTSLPQYKYGQFSVTRRFRDFDWLHSQLGQKHPGAIVPPLPEKHSAQVSTMRMSGVGCSAEWLEQRRSQLQRFLQRVAAHPQLHSAPDLQTFLEATEDTLEAWKESSKQAKQSSYMSMLGEVKQGLLSLSSYSLRASMLSSESIPPVVAVTDVACQQMGNYAAALETQIAAVHKHSKKFIERHRALASSMSGFGLSLTQLANCEAEYNASLAKALSTMGLCVDRMSSLYEEQAAKGALAFEEPMKDYIRMLGSCKQAISARDNALKALNSAASVLAAKRDRFEKMRSKEDKAARELREAEEMHTVAKQEYEQVAARVDAEMARFQREKLADFKQIMVGFVSLQLEYSQRIQAAWRDLLPHLDLVPGEGTESGCSATLE